MYFCDWKEEATLLCYLELTLNCLEIEISFILLTNCKKISLNKNSA